MIGANVLYDRYQITRNPSKEFKVPNFTKTTQNTLNNIIKAEKVEGLTNQKTMSAPVNVEDILQEIQMKIKIQMDVEIQLEILRFL